MTRPLSSLTRWVLATVLAGVATGAIACCEPPVEEVGFLDVNGIVTTLAVPGATLTIPDGINNAGQIVGSFGIPAPFGIQGFLYTGGTFTQIAVPGAEFETDANGINNAGQIVGEFAGSGFHGFLYAAGTYSTVDVPGQMGTSAEGINDAGQIVGSFIVNDVPEPSALALFSVGLSGLGLTWRKRKQARP